MSIDILALQQFYANEWGKVAQQEIAAAAKIIWPDDGGGIGKIGLYGYGVNFAALWHQAKLQLALMPAHQGVARWPACEQNKALLVEESGLPFADATFDRLLVCHGLEHARELSALLDELWRVLTPHGQMIIIVPARRGLWARAESTPFGHGRPFSRLQLNQIITQHGFKSLAEKRALYMPPWPHKGGIWPILSWGCALGLKQFAPRMGGVILLQVEKIYMISKPLRPKPKRVNMLAKPIQVVTAGREPVES